MVKVSIVITTYNRRNLLKRAIRSALHQNYENYEIIVVNDAGCWEEPYFHSKVSWISHDINKGLSATRNTGIGRAFGEYVVCLDDDNELCPNFLKETIEAIGDYDAVGVGRIIQYKDFAHTIVPVLNKFTSIDQAWLIKKEVFNEIKYDEKLRANEDADFGIRFFKKYKAKVIEKPLCMVHDTENSLSFPDERELKGMQMFLDKNLCEYKDYPDELRYLYRLEGRKIYRGGYSLKGLNYFWKSFLAYPRINSFAHLFFILFGWTVYDKFMSLIEKHG
jgi:glycosyltransferase involved in cell wall biosynthesis